MLTQFTDTALVHRRRANIVAHGRWANAGTRTLVQPVFHTILHNFDINYNVWCILRLTPLHDFSIFGTWCVSSILEGEWIFVKLSEYV